LNRISGYENNLTNIFSRRQLSSRGSASQMENWVFDPRPGRESP